MASPHEILNHILFNKFIHFRVLIVSLLLLVRHFRFGWRRGGCWFGQTLYMDMNVKFVVVLFRSFFVCVWIHNPSILCTTITEWQAAANYYIALSVGVWKFFGIDKLHKRDTRLIAYIPHNFAIIRNYQLAEFSSKSSSHKASFSRHTARRFDDMHSQFFHFYSPNWAFYFWLKFSFDLQISRLEFNSLFFEMPSIFPIFLGFEWRAVGPIVIGMFDMAGQSLSDDR